MPFSTGTRLDIVLASAGKTKTRNNTFFILKHNAMHNLDRTTNEYEFNNEFEYEGEGEFEFEFEGEGEFEFEGELEGEALELELATELLEVTNEYELEQFLGNVFKKIGRGVSSFAKSPIGKGLLGGLKSIAKKALPIAGGALGNLVAPGVGGMIGNKLGSFASSMFEMELEGLSNEDREFEVARRFVRFASDATRRASSAAAAGAPPRAAVGSALKQAAYNHAPGLLRKRRGAGGRYGGRPVGRRSYGGGGYDNGGAEGTTGTWVRDGNNIIVYGA